MAKRLRKLTMEERLDREQRALAAYKHRAAVKTRKLMKQVVENVVLGCHIRDLEFEIAKLKAQIEASKEGRP